MAESTDSIPTHVEGGNDLVTSPPREQLPPARPRPRRSWYHRPANLASPASPRPNRGLLPRSVYSRSPLQGTVTEREAKRPRRAQAFRSQDVTIQSLDSMLEERRTRVVSESASAQEEEVRSYTPDGSPPETSFWETEFDDDSAPEVKTSVAGDVAQVQTPDTPSKTPAKPDGNPTKSARIISGLSCSPARVYRAPGQILITKTCRRWRFTEHNVGKCKGSHGAHGKKIGKEKDPPSAEAQGSRTTWLERTSRLTRVIMGRVSKRKD